MKSKKSQRGGNIYNLSPIALVLALIIGITICYTIYTFQAAPTLKEWADACEKEWADACEKEWADACEREQVEEPSPA